MPGQDKISSLIAKKGQELITSLVPSITQMASQAGIENIGQPNEKIPNSCLPPSELNKMLSLRNSLLGKLNSTSQTIEILSKPINSLNTVINSTTTTLNTVNTARIAANIAISLIPPPASPPGAAISTINNLKDLSESLIPIINNAKNNSNSISTSIDYTNKIIVNLLNLLKSIDKYLTGCNISKENLTSPNNYITTAEQNFNKVQTEPSTNEIYKGFILSVVSESYSPTVNRVKAIATNDQGIILLQTPLSFTTTPQVLISEIKLIIDSNNLKAN